MSAIQHTRFTSPFQEQRAIERQDAFVALIESLRREAPASKPMAVAGVDPLDETPAEPDPIEIPCQDCAGSGFDSGALDPFGEICQHCMGSGLEPATEVPVTVPARVSTMVPMITRCGVVSIGPGLFVRTRRRRS
jgi:hypothetical protein